MRCEMDDESVWFHHWDTKSSCSEASEYRKWIHWVGAFCFTFSSSRDRFRTIKSENCVRKRLDFLYCAASFVRELVSIILGTNVKAGRETEMDRERSQAEGIKKSKLISSVVTHLNVEVSREIGMACYLRSIVWLLWYAECQSRQQHNTISSTSW